GGGSGRAGRLEGGVVLRAVVRGGRGRLRGVRRDRHLDAGAGGLDLLDELVRAVAEVPGRVRPVELVGPLGHLEGLVEVGGPLGVRAGEPDMPSVPAALAPGGTGLYCARATRAADPPASTGISSSRAATRLQPHFLAWTTWPPYPPPEARAAAGIPRCRLAAP